MPWHNCFGNMPCLHSTWRAEFMCCHPNKRIQGRCVQYKQTCPDYEADIIDLEVAPEKL